jgi:hypothetical protein
MVLQDMEWGGMNWIDLAQEMDRWQAGSIKFWEFLD